MSENAQYVARNPYRKDAVVGWRDLRVGALARDCKVSLEEMRRILDGSHEFMVMLDRIAERLGITHQELMERIARARKLRELGEFPEQLQNGEGKWV